MVLSINIIELSAWGGAWAKIRFQINVKPSRRVFKFCHFILRASTLIQ